MGRGARANWGRSCWEVFDMAKEANEGTGIEQSIEDKTERFATLLWEENDLKFQV